MLPSQSSLNNWSSHEEVTGHHITSLNTFLTERWAELDQAGLLEMSHHRPRNVGHLSVVEFTRLSVTNEINDHFKTCWPHLEGVPVLSLDLAALQGQGGVGVVGQGGQGGLARVQLGLPTDLATLEVEICLGVLQPRPASLFSAKKVSNESKTSHVIITVSRRVHRAAPPYWRADGWSCRLSGTGRDPWGSRRPPPWRGRAPASGESGMHKTWCGGTRAPGCPSMTAAGGWSLGRSWVCLPGSPCTCPVVG